jgi:hypothetical protein
MAIPEVYLICSDSLLLLTSCWLMVSFMQANCHQACPWAFHGQNAITACHMYTAVLKHQSLRYFCISSEIVILNLATCSNLKKVLILLISPLLEECLCTHKSVPLQNLESNTVFLSKTKSCELFSLYFGQRPSTRVSY